MDIELNKQEMKNNRVFLPPPDWNQTKGEAKKEQDICDQIRIKVNWWNSYTWDSRHEPNGPSTQKTMMK